MDNDAMTLALDKIRSVVGRLMGASSDRDDVVSEVTLWFLERTHDGKTTDLTRKMIRWRALDVLRRKKVQVMDPDVMADVVMAPDDGMTDAVPREIDIAVIVSHACLTWKDEVILYKRFYDDMTTHEIALDIGMTDAEVGRRITQSLTRMKALTQ